MARRSSAIALADGDTWIDIFKWSQAPENGDDGDESKGLLLTCLAASAAPAEYRLENPADPDGEYAILQPGESVRLEGQYKTIKHLVGRGSGGEATVAIEEVIY